MTHLDPKNDYKSLRYYSLKYLFKKILYSIKLKYKYNKFQYCM